MTVTVPMDPERWRRIEALFDEVADLPRAEQDARLAAACGDDAALRDEVARLLARDRAREPWLERLVAGAAQLASAPLPDPAGRRVGPFRIVREVGRGGQGVVFEAIRDGEFHQRVALKVATRATFGAEFVERFRHERQILAQLEHPHIARLLDGGTAEDGTPWFAMEFVEGVPIHRYAIERRLAVDERLGLFLQACDAVDHAHQNLVIHRDLKPGNIFVTEGSVRLLDFGIAKLAAPGDTGQTALGAAPVTPDYCSPEQLRGLPVTTRTDVYSLGLVLFELLTGARAQKADTTSPVTLDRSICETPLEAPSAHAAADGDPRLARRLRGDLDTIVLTAAHKDPARRYASVAALADDVRRHLSSRPIKARQDRRWYRATRFARRHWKALAASLALVATLAAGIVATAWQARRAERRFEQVRGIANALVRDVHAANRDLPASTRAQEVVLRTAVQYLDGLSAEAGDDRALQVEVARGYMEVALLAYSMSRPSLGRPAEALAHYEKARAILEPLRARHGGELEVATANAALHTALAAFYTERERRDEALASALLAIELGESAVRAHPRRVEAMDALWEAMKVLLADHQASPEARTHLPRFLEVTEQLAAMRPRDVEALAQLGIGYAQAGKMASSAGREDESLRYYRRNMDLQAQVVALAPENATARRNLMLGWSHVSDTLLGPLGSSSYSGSGGPPAPLDPSRRAQALEASQKAVEQAEWLRSRNPGDDEPAFDYAIALGRMAPAFAPGDGEAIAVLRRSLALLDTLAASHPGATTNFQVEFRGSLAERLRQAGRLPEALSEWRTVEAMLRRSVTATPGNYYVRRLAIPMFQNWSMTLVTAGQRAEGLAIAHRAVVLADELSGLASQYARAPGWPPRVRGWLADLHESMGSRSAAAAARAESRALWAAVASRQDLPQDLYDEAREALASPPPRE